MFDILSHIQNAARLAGLQWLAPTIFSFAAVFLLVFGVANYIRRRNIVRRRAILDRGLTSPELSAGQDWLSSPRSLRFQNLSSTSVLLGEIELGARHDEKEASKIRRELLRAGYFQQSSVIWYQAVRASLLFGSALISFMIMVRFFSETSLNVKIIVALFAAAVGFILPSQFVASRQNRMVHDCQDGFPDFIDLMVVCAEAGISARAALDKLARELAHTQPYLGAHLYMASLEVRAGSSLHDALMGVARRTQVEEAATLAALLQQTEQMGTSITDALRVYSDEMRHRRLVRAEEKAHALPVKLVIPLGLYVFPVILIVILLPVIVRMRHAVL